MVTPSLVATGGGGALPYLAQTSICASEQGTVFYPRYRLYTNLIIKRQAFKGAWKLAMSALR